MSTGGILDDYLDELLLDAMPPAAPAVAPVVAADAAPAPAPAEADVAVAELDPPAAVVAAPLDTPTPADDVAPLAVEAVADTAADSPHNMTPGSDDMIASIMDEFDAEFAPTPAAAPVTTAPSVDMVASIMDEFDAEFGTAPAASPAAMAAGSDDMVASIMDEFDAEFGAAPAASPAPVAAGSSAMVASIMDEFDAEFGAAPAAAPAAGPASEHMVASIMDEFDAEMAAASTPYVPATDDAPMPPAPTPSARAAAAPAQPATTWQQIQAQAHIGRDDSHTRRANERMSRWLRLRCGTQAYALELLKVQEVVLPVPLLHLRGTAPSVLGIMNLRGQVVPVIDLGLHLGSAPIGEDAQTRIVVLEEHGEVMGLRVSAVEDVTNLSDSQIEPPDTARICQISNDLFRGIARLAKQPMILLDATRLLQ